ncbi:MAG: PAS domain S-box protein [Peptococcaceae bacterium]|nr:PAS domain S-box protein [Peptococcaceae bacterium]
MTSKIFKSILSVAIAVLLASLVVITGMLYQYFGTMQESQLKDELSLAASATEQLGQSYLSQLDSDRYRLTWVDADGMVIFDTHADSATMDNHENREEIREALLTGTGSSVRQSSTLTEQTIYEAVRLEDGSVLRISVSRATAFVLVIGMFQPILMVLFFAAGLSAWLARRMAKRVVEPLNNLNLDQPMENEAYEELSPLLHRIHTQHIEIEQQMQELQHKRDEFDQITDNMKEALVLLDHSGRILSINPAAKNLYEIASVTIGEDFLTLERKQFMREALEQAKVQGHAEFRAQKNGRDYQFDVNRIDSDGNIRGMVILAYDITEQVNAEKHRQAFTANVSHELKTPLQAIIGSAELMENGIVKTDDLPRFVGHIRKEASRLLYLIDDIIRLSQLDEGAEMDQEDVPLKQLAEEVSETLTDAAKLKDVTLNVTGDEVVMHGVRRLLYEILYNLCDNAIKYNRAGGSVTVSVSQRTNEICVSVKDTGIGIPPEHQDKIFERFYRVDKSHSKQSGGTGLGLSIVKHAVQYHHGKIVLASQVNVGTTITVLFDTTA